MDAAHLLKASWPFVLAVAPGVYAVWRQWLSSRRAGFKDRNDLVRIAQEAAGEVIEDLRAENARVRDQLARIEREFGEFRRMHDGMIADKDAELALLRGENRQLKALAEAYERLLEAHHIPHEKPTQPFWRVEPGNLPPVEIEPL